jgi:hypothetical protein
MGDSLEDKTGLAVYRKNGDYDCSYLCVDYSPSSETDMFEYDGECFERIDVGKDGYLQDLFPLHIGFLEEIDFSKLSNSDFFSEHNGDSSSALDLFISNDGRVFIRSDLKKDKEYCNNISDIINMGYSFLNCLNRN